MVTFLKNSIRWWQLILLFSLSFSKSKYKQKYLRFVWMLIHPLFMLLILSFIFSKVTDFSSLGIPYSVFCLVALIPWVFFATSLSCTISVLNDNFNLITRINFPKVTLVLGSIMAVFYDFLVHLIILTVFFAIFHVPVGIYAFYAIPVFLVQIMLTVGICLILSVVNLYLLDTRQALSIVLQVWMLASPVAYSSDTIKGNLAPFYFLNPMSGLLEAYRSCFLYNRPPDGQNFMIAAAVSFVMFIIGYGLFKAQEPTIADIV
jgi:lipopolysaccharide transport system permease protein